MRDEYGSLEGWQIVRRDDGSFAVGDDHGMVAGPFATAQQAREAAWRLPRPRHVADAADRTTDRAGHHSGANPPQHLVGDYGAPPLPDHRRTEALPTGEDTAGVRDVADPHPANEEHYDRERHPGGANPPRDPGPNDRIHAGSPPPQQSRAVAPPAAPLHTGGREEVPTDGDARPMGGTNRFAGFPGLGIGFGIAIALLLLLTALFVLNTGSPGPGP